jgi:hypothetical protein
MAEVVTGEHSRYRNNLIDAHRESQVVLWDCGPEKPRSPVRPIAPKGMAGDAEYDLAVIELKEKLEDYEAALKRYKRDQEDFEHWHAKNGGPIEFQMWSCDARDALEHDARAVHEGRQSRKRYYLSSKTRGYAHLANNGLPAGVTPGRGHEANLDRQAADDQALARARREDPVFGEDAA